MTTIKLFYTSKYKLASDSFCILVNGKEVDYSIDQQTITLSVELDFGSHNLVILPQPHIGKFKIRFDNVQINSAALKHSLSLAYSIRQGQMENTNMLSEYYPNWHLPFGNPVSWWLSETMNHFNTQYAGSNLTDNYQIFYPESTEIDQTFPTVVKDFFKYNFGFYSYDKKLNENPLHQTAVPFVRLPNLKYNEAQMLKEFTEHIHLFDQGEVNHYYNFYDADWNETLHKPFMVLRPIGDSLTEVFPEFTRLLNSLLDDGIKISLSFIGVLPPGSFLPPHVDSFYKPAEGYSHSGCCKIWIPIGWNPGSYFKFDKIGLLPHEQGAHLINPHNFTHCTINQSSSPRFSVGFNCEFHDDAFLKYIRE